MKPLLLNTADSDVTDDFIISLDYYLKKCSPNLKPLYYFLQYDNYKLRTILFRNMSEVFLKSSNGDCYSLLIFVNC